MQKIKKKKISPRAMLTEELEQVALTHEATGMIPTPPQNEEEAASYEEMSATPIHRTQKEETAK